MREIVLLERLRAAPRNSRHESALLEALAMGGNCGDGHAAECTASCERFFRLWLVYVRRATERRAEELEESGNRCLAMLQASEAQRTSLHEQCESLVAEQRHLLFDLREAREGTLDSRRTDEQQRTEQMLTAVAASLAQEIQQRVALAEEGVLLQAERAALEADKADLESELAFHEGRADSLAAELAAASQEWQAAEEAAAQERNALAERAEAAEAQLEEARAEVWQLTVDLREAIVARVKEATPFKRGERPLGSSLRAVAS